MTRKKHWSYSSGFDAHHSKMLYQTIPLGCQQNKIEKEYPKR